LVFIQGIRESGWAVARSLFYFQGFGTRDG
jgi:hypothetical protein